MSINQHSSDHSPQENIFSQTHIDAASNAAVAFVQSPKNN